MADTSFYPPILNDNIQIPQKIIHADQTATITSINDFTSLLDGPGRYIVETNSTSRTTLLSIGLIPANVSGILEVIRVDEAEYDYYLNYRGENNKRWFATMIMGICSVWQEAAIKSDLDALNSQITQLTNRMDAEYVNTQYAINNANLNDYVVNGKYWFGTGATNAPVSSWFGMNVEHYLSGMTIQTVTAAGGGQWVRTYNGSSWTSWLKTTP